MTRREEILRLMELKRQAIWLLNETYEDQVKKHRADLKSLAIELRELDYVEKIRATAA